MQMLQMFSPVEPGFHPQDACTFFDAGIGKFDVAVVCHEATFFCAVLVIYGDMNFTDF